MLRSIANLRTLMHAFYGPNRVQKESWMFNSVDTITKIHDLISLISIFCKKKFN